MVERRKVLNIIYWILLLIGIVLILWRVFGNSPSDIQVISPFITLGILKIWDIGNELKDFKHEVKMSFSKVREDVNKTGGTSQ